MLVVVAVPGCPAASFVNQVIDRLQGPTITELFSETHIEFFQSPRRDLRCVHKPRHAYFKSDNKISLKIMITVRINASMTFVNFLSFLFFREFRATVRMNPATEFVIISETFSFFVRFAVGPCRCGILMRNCEIKATKGNTKCSSISCRL